MEPELIPAQEVDLNGLKKTANDCVHCDFSYRHKEMHQVCMESFIVNSGAKGKDMIDAMQS